MVGTTEILAAELLRIVGGNGDYRHRVDAMSATLLKHDDTTVKTALLIALASVPPQPARDWTPSR